MVQTIEVRVQDMGPVEIEVLVVSTNRRLGEEIIAEKRNYTCDQKH